MLTMENEFDSKLRIEGNSSSPNSDNNGANPQRSKSFAFRAPQENFSIQDFELGNIYGVGSYSKNYVWRFIFSSFVFYLVGALLKLTATVFLLYSDAKCKLQRTAKFSLVVRAKKKDTGIVYAMKIMDKKFITKENKTAYVKLERIVLDQLDHPGVVRLFFTFQDTFSLYMALESCEGGELFDQITRKGRLSEDEARFYAAEIVDALEYIHSMGLIHRDIKPENLLLSEDGHIKIADFGSVKPMKDSQITVLPNAASDDKACTFVGTAAYVPPEVLNSSPATFGNDLWALGCTLYQMLSGTSPFKDASEWLIFQRIIARDIRFPSYFSAEARDLIDQLLDIDPSKRPGVGPNGYASLKGHPFFKGIDWKNLRAATPPKLALDPRVLYVTSTKVLGENTYSFHLVYCPLIIQAQSTSSEDQEPSWNPSHVGDGSVILNDANGDFASASEVGSITRLASIDSFDSKWKLFLEPGESVIMISMVKKLQKLTKKKVQLILTNKPKLFYVDPAKLVIKGNIIWSDNHDDLSIEVTSPSNFKICTPKKVFTFVDDKQRAMQWKKAIEALQNR
ncbi:3-phosphoinositide-dependent protein kinase [Striga asiatica]|uniref:non-specific serine/threonine protein kinase n=1 Tax=Striga asiatica TaxID=4170 RepID=A0A5A7P806_STRAF|nr:3-phosphoinositide-dependent protein kinase [Striga asiatica]